MGSDTLPRVTGHSGNPPGQGPFMKLTLVVGDGIVREASYETYQCPACHDCGKALCSLVRAKTLEEAGALTWQALADRVGPLPKAKRLCYSLALLALDDALKKLADGKH